MSFLNDVKQKIRGRLRAKALAPYGVGYFVDTPQGMFVVDPIDQLISRKLIRNGAYETGTIAYLRRFLNPDSVVVFVGAHIGTLLVPLAKDVRSVYAYEADPVNYRYLDYNRKINCLDRVRAYNLAVGDCDGCFVDIKHNTLNSGNSSIVIGQGTGPSRGPTPGQSGVAMIRLDSHLGATESRVDLIVMDIEGAEAHAIRGMPHLLENTGVLFTEFSNKYLAAMGSSCRDFAELLAPHFASMQTFDERNYYFADRAWVEYLASFDDVDAEVVINIALSSAQDVQKDDAIRFPG